LKFNLKGIEIECENEGKLLGVAIYFKLNFNDHISNICKKSSRQRILLSSSKALINLLMSVSAYERVLSSA
jgi:hypothetical protein